MRENPLASLAPLAPGARDPGHGSAVEALMTRRFWTTAEVEVLMRLYPDTPTADLARTLGRPLWAVYQKARLRGLAKSAAYQASPHACRLRRGDEVGKASRFSKGHVPANKGLRRPGYGPGRMRETQFKAGQRGNKYAPIGSERVADGYRQRKVNDTGYPPRDWQPVHRLLWEAAYGPIPKGYVVTFIDDDKTHVVLENLCLMSRADLGRRNTMWNRYPRELAETIQLAGALKRKINRRNTREEQD